MLVTLTMIVKDEAATIRQTLQSVEPFVDAWCILDTGSTDGTRDIIRATMREIPGRVFAGPFIDFSTARNHVLDLAHKHSGCDWALMLSGDETLSGNATEWRELLAASCVEAHDVPVQYGPDLRYASPRLSRLATPWRYQGKTHEVLCHPAGTLPEIALPGLEIAHTPRPKTSTALERDLSLLQGDDSPRGLFYRGQTYEGLGNLWEAFWAYEARVGRTDGWHEERFEAALRLARVAEKLDHPWPDVQTGYLRAYALSPHRAEPLYAIADHYRRREEQALALLFAEQALNAAGRPHQDRLFVRDVRAGAADIAAVACYALGYWARGLPWALRALHASPGDPRLIRNVEAFKLKLSCG